MTSELSEESMRQVASVSVELLTHCDAAGANILRHLNLLVETHHDGEQSILRPRLEVMAVECSEI